jgi:hypothetical protein
MSKASNEKAAYVAALLLKTSANLRLPLVENL